jgi:zinc-binding in reverse transcriptase
MQQELAWLLNMLQAYTITPRVQDKPIWRYNESCLFSTESAYKFLMNSPHKTVTHKLLWKVKAPSRVQIFAWLALHNKILTTNNLTKRDFQIPNMCHLCRVQQEIVQHLFQECAYTVRLREYLLQIMPNRYSQINQLASTKEILLSTHFDIYWKNLEITTIFVLWRERFRRISAQEKQDITQTV